MKVGSRESFVSAEIKSLASEVDALRDSVIWAEKQEARIVSEAKEKHPNLSVGVPGIYTPDWARDLKFIGMKIIRLVAYMEQCDDKDVR